MLAGYANPANWLADIADVESCTAREWIRIGRRARALPAIANAFANGSLSYSKVRTLTRYAEPDNEAELCELAVSVPASELGRVLAAWMIKTSTPEQMAAHHHKHRSIKWRTEPDGMVTFTLRLPPALAATLIALLTTLVMRTRTRPDASGVYPTLAQQHADAFIRALIHDADGRPINASHRRRHPTTRQKRVVKERDQSCIDCGRNQLSSRRPNRTFHRRRIPVDWRTPILWAHHEWRNN